MDEFTIRRPDDFHVHLRQGAMLQLAGAITSKFFDRGLVMPNTLPPILTGKDACTYRDEIAAVTSKYFTPLMTIKITGETTPMMITGAKAAGVIAGKLYPEGVTTNSQDGVRNIYDLWPVFHRMQTLGMVLCLHGEMPGVFVLDREREFLAVLRRIAQAFPRLRIVLEHVSTADAVKCVKNLPDNVAATITVHHLVLTLDDVIGDMLEPHHFCKPVAKTPQDRDALIDAAIGGNPKFFLGTDSAPHLRNKKECASGCAGVFTAPVALPILAQVFEAASALDKLEAFTSVHGAQFYGLPLNGGEITFTRASWKVPAEYDGVVPLWANKSLEWIVG